METAEVKRLTFEGNFCDISQCIGEHRMTSMCENGDCDARKVWYRLKEYEDTGLTPEDLKPNLNAAVRKKLACEYFGLSANQANHIEELAQAEQDGRLFISPVKVGDMLWPICWDGVLGAWVVDNQPERINEVGSKGFFVAAGYSDPEAPDEFHPYEDIGDRYFQSREEAVAAMAVKEKPEEVQGDGE